MPAVPRRADARANHERLLDAAEEFFGEQGLDASLRVLTERAGMGIGTFYRHFPQRLDLMRALQRRLIDEMHEYVTAASELPTGWERMVGYIDGGVRVGYRHPIVNPLGDWLRRHDPEFTAETRWNSEILAAVDLAHAEGALRPDASATDVSIVTHLLCSLLGFPEPARSVLVARLRRVLLDGLRTEAAHEPLPTAALSVEQFRELIGRGGR